MHVQGATKNTSIFQQLSYAFVFKQFQSLLRSQFYECQLAYSICMKCNNCDVSSQHPAHTFFRSTLYECGLHRYKQLHDHTPAVFAASTQN